MAKEGAQQRDRDKAGERERERVKARERERWMQKVKAIRLKVIRLKVGLRRARAGSGVHPQAGRPASQLEGEGQQSHNQRQSLSAGHEPSPSSSPRQRLNQHSVL